MEEVNKDLKFKAGQLVTITTGEYDDCRCIGIFKVLIDFDAKQKSLTYMGVVGEGFSDGGFAAWLCKKGLVKEKKHRELWVELPLIREQVVYRDDLERGVGV